ncbi:MAG: hypothetical protein IPL20_00080 [Saprospiraceae bacterium]|nr:hypothetical protein [Saprospiraceae bacterium]
MNNFLKSNNRKVHFFFIDYDRENRPDDDGIKQSDYLAAASTYFKNNAVFGKSTDAIFNYLAFINTLKDNCKKYSINGED